MSLRFICIEVRKNLRCANVFLKFDQSLTETEFLKINVDEHALRLEEYSAQTLITMGEHFTIEARTISNLTVHECNASFRLSIDNIKENENAGLIKCDWENICQSSKLIPELVEGKQAAIHCRNCECNLNGVQRYKRIREYPTGSIDINEFFCHHGPNFSEVLVPQAADFFFGFQFIVLNKDMLQRTTKEKETHLYCHRCLQYLGETLFTGKAAKLWSDTLRIKVDSDLQNIFCDKTETSTSHLLQKVVQESAVGGDPEFHNIHLSKVLLTAAFPNRKQKYLMLQILEKDLSILRNADPLSYDYQNNNNVLEVQLGYFKGFKLIYCFVDGLKILETVEDKKKNESNINTKRVECQSMPPLLAFWQQDISIHTHKISPTLFSALLQELEENSSLIPEFYRFTQDNFQLSYIFY